MALLKSISLFLTMTFAFSGLTQGQSGISVTIDKVSSGVQITGNTTGLTDAARKAHKIVVYVKTDKWYIHPFANGGDGKSFASIGANGSWKIGTKKRAFSATAIAALVIPRDSTAPATAESLGDIPSVAVTERELEGTSDFGKL